MNTERTADEADTASLLDKRLKAILPMVKNLQHR